MVDSLPGVGWREWLALPDLGIDKIKAKIDTGAKTCALHAHYVEPFEQDNEQWVRFGIHPNQNNLMSVDCVARLHDQRSVTDSGGHTEERYVISTTVVLGDQRFETEMTLTNRDSMRFRMLIGRNALKGRFIVDAGRSFLLGKSNNIPGDDELEDEESDATEE